MRHLGTALLDLIHPVRCAGCARVFLPSGAGFWCDDCLKGLPWVHGPLCPRCGSPFSDSPTSGDHLCGECILGRYAFDTARSATEFKGVVRERIHQLKFGAQLHWIHPLSELLARTLSQQHIPAVDLVLPVPLHISRLRYRGFNQSAILARALSRRTSIPVCFDLLVRRCRTEPQTRLSRQERLTNVKDAFHVLRPASVEGLALLLIDDVFTTGSTINECAKTLKSAGAAQVHALTVARALPG